MDLCTVYDVLHGAFGTGKQYRVLSVSLCGLSLGLLDGMTLPCGNDKRVEMVGVGVALAGALPLPLPFPGPGVGRIGG